MGVGDLFEVDAGGCEDVYYVDTGAFDTGDFASVYVLDTERPAVVDTGLGTNYERIVDAMEQVGIAPHELAVIALTHVHLDHAGGAGFLAAECPNATVYAHHVGAPHLVDPAKLVAGTKDAVGDQWTHYTEPRPLPESRVEELHDGDTVDLGDRALTAHHAPGHAPHQVVFADDADDAVFTGDAAGVYVPSRDAVVYTTPPPTFDLEQCLADVQRIRRLDPEVLCYGHFGAAETDDRLREYAEVLTEWVDRVADRRAKLGDDRAIAEYFATGTAMKDVWGGHKARAEERMNVRGVLEYLDRQAGA
ncbi:MAG: MBL fold metallo-hydrolase [Halorientalis sp.]